MATKITLDDGRVFEVGQEVEWQDVNGFWKKRTLIAYGRGDSSISVDSILTAPPRVRHIAPKTITKVARTMREVDHIINVRRCEWRCKNVDATLFGATLSNAGGEIWLESYCSKVCEYRTSPESEWQGLEFKDIGILTTRNV